MINLGICTIQDKYQNIQSLREKIVYPKILVVSIIFFLAGCLLFSLYYLKFYYLNYLSWLCWSFSVFALLWVFFPKKISLKSRILSIDKSDILVFLFVFVLYWGSHLWNFSSAPWNSNGLFDDAAWDIYFANNHVFNNTPIQPAYFDTVGYISREVPFHYYISIFFRLFGANLLVFNTSLLVLGFITVLFTVFLIRKMFNNPYVTILCALVINFFPLHFNHIFMGHRYAITAPLMMVSLYYLYSAFVNNSPVRTIISSIFAALCFSSAIMGKQFLYALVIAGILLLIKEKGRIPPRLRALGFVWVVGLIFSASPMLIYIFFNFSDYVGREKSLLDQFITAYQSNGLLGIKPYFDQIKELFFAPFSYRRQFLPDFPVIPFAYYLFILPGLMISVIKRHYEIFLLAIIPTMGTLLSGAFDFRILLSAPAWVICLAFSLDFFFKKLSNKNSFLNFITAGIGLTVIIAFGLIPSINYLWGISKDPNHLHLLPHKDVAVSRLVQDIVAGADSPNFRMKPTEFHRTPNPGLVPHDTLVCPESAYAIMHLYLQKYDDKKILAFSNQGIQLLKTPEEILNDNLNAIHAYQPSGKDLKLVWEVTPKTEKIVNFFENYQIYGDDRRYAGEVDGHKFSLYVLTIKYDRINQFRRDLLGQNPTTIFNDKSYF